MAAIRQGRGNWHTRALAAGFVLAAIGNLCGQEATNPKAVTWKTGTALRKQLDASIGITWNEIPARDALAGLSRNTGVAIFLDRRVDPGMPLDLKLANVPLEAALQRIADSLQAGTALVGSVVYIGPKAAAGKLATLAAIKRQEAAQVPAPVRGKLLKSEAWSWDDLAEPPQLLADLAKRGGVQVANLELVPHDLWPAADWPAMSWAERLTLLLAGFDLTFEFEPGGTHIRLVPLPEKVSFEKTYLPRGDATAAAANLRKLVPDATIAVENQRLRIDASPEDHDQISRLLSGDSVRTTKVTPGEKRDTLTVENQPAGAVIKTVAAQLGKEMKYDSSLTEKLKTNVTFTVKDVPLQELLETTLKPLGLTYKVEEKALEIIAK